MTRQAEGYAIEICGEKDTNNTLCECFPTWDEAIKRLVVVVEELIEKYDSKPICLLRLSSQKTCNAAGAVSVYSFTKVSVIVQIRAVFRETSSLQSLPCAQSSLVN